MTEAKIKAVGSEYNLRSRIIAATVAMCALIGTFGGWAVSAQLSSAVIAQGSIVVDQNVKKVQHQDGGIVGSIKVRDGDAVRAGDLLVTLDDTQVRATLAVVQSQIAEMLGRRARLMSERDGQDTINFPATLAGMSAEGQQIIAGERRVFLDNILTRESQKEQLKLRIEQLEQEITGLKAQRLSKLDELKPVTSELEQSRQLHDRQLTTISRVNVLVREAARISGAIAALDSQIPRTKGQISEVRLQILTVGQNARSEAQRELRTVEARLTELNERQVASEDRLKRMDIRAPVSGTVHQMAVHTIGGIVTAAEPLLVLVPESDRLAIEVRFAPTDIDQLSLGQKARVRFSAFNQRTTPEMPARLTRISADISVDPKTGGSYYVGRLDLYQTAMTSVGGRQLLPGMPVEIFVETAQRTAFSYFAKPLMDNFTRALREE